MKKSRLTIIGHFGGNEEILDGQTIKTKILYNELINKSNFNIKTVDTYYKRKRPLKLVFSSIKNIFISKNIIILLSGNGMKIYFPILYIFSKIFKKNIYHDVIGGNLHIYVNKYPKYVKYLNSFKVNWVETNLLKNKLNELGINNVEVIPNFKRLNIINKSDIKENNSNCFQFCTFSRVMEEKGITYAIKTVDELRKKGYNCKLDIYGPIDENYRNSFNKLLKKYEDNVNYCGIVSYDKSVEILKKYDLLLFPTFWDGEGFPGTIIDAFSAALPVVATDWNCNSEIIANYVNGIIYPNDKEKNLDEAIIRIINDKELLNKMKFNCINEAKKYLPDEYIKKIISCIN